MEVGDAVHFQLEENIIGIVGFASMSYKAQLQRCIQQLGYSFGRGILKQKGMLEWKIHVVDDTSSPIYSHDNQPFVIRMLVSRELGRPVGLTRITPKG